MTINSSSFSAGLPIGDPDIYTDLSGLEKIKQMGRGESADREQALESVAKQFESVFLNMMMKSMRDANEAFKDESMSGSNEMEFYQGMFDQQLTLSMSKRGVGIADALVRQLKQQMPQLVGEGTSLTSTPSMTETMIRAAQSPQASIEQPIESLEDFKARLLPLAEKSAKELGVDPRFILSQAALETGWGQHMIKDPSGSNSYNLFGIKANSDWSGKTAVVSTLEYREGMPVKERANFRAYESYADSFDDYVAFIKDQSRYRGAIESANDPVEYVKELQNAGYATDPEYANKILAIVNQHFPVAEPDRG